MKIRFAVEKDLKQIIELCRLHAAFEQVNFEDNDKEGLLSKYLFKEDSCIQCLVVEEEKELVGYATFFKQFSTWNANYYVYLDCLFLKEDTRGKGIGFRIMEEIKAYAKAQDCKMIQWQTPNFNTNAINFYKKIGAEAKNKERFFWDV